MEINLLNLRSSINKAYLKVKPNRIQIETFKKNITNLFDQIKESESEELLYKSLMRQRTGSVRISAMYIMKLKISEKLTGLLIASGFVILL
jgi:hypothetical protein